MAAELQSLLDKIQSEGIAKAEAEARRILEEAREQAEKRIADAKRAEEEARQRSEAEAEQFRRRAEQAVRQAARDVLLGVREAVDQTLQRVLLAEIQAALDPEVLKTLLVDAVKAYVASTTSGGKVEVGLAPEQLEALRDHLLKSVKVRAEQELTIRADDDLRGGFRVRVADGRIEHDFSTRAIQGAMARLLRPSLATLLTDDA